MVLKTIYPRSLLQGCSFSPSADIPFESNQPVE